MREEVHMRFRNTDPLVVGDKVFISSNVWDLSEKDLEKARIELGETEEKKQKCLQELKIRLSKEGDYRLDDPFLLHFIRVRKYDLEKAYLNIKNGENFRKKYPDWIGNPSTFATLKNYDFVRCLPYADEEGHILFCLDIGTWNPKVETFEEAMRAIVAVTEMATMNPKFQIHGIIGICDMKGLRKEHAVELLKKNRFLTYVTLALFTVPWRVNKIIVLNSGRLVRFLFGMVRPLMSKKISERILLLGSDYKELHQYVNPAILPKELGGTLRDDQVRGRDFIVDNIPYLEYDRSFTGEKKS